MKKNIFAVILSVVLIFSHAGIVSAQAAPNGSVGVTHNADGTCQVALPSGTMSGMTAIDVNGEQICVVVPIDTPGEPPLPIIEDLDDYFDETFPPEPPAEGDIPPVGPPAEPAPSLLLLADGGTIATVTSIYQSVIVSWQVVNVTPFTCRGVSSDPDYPFWSNTLKHPSEPIPVNTPYTYHDSLSTFTVDTTFTMTGCKGTDGTTVPDQTVLIRVESPEEEEDEVVVEEEEEETTPSTTGTRWQWTEN